MIWLCYTCYCMKIKMNFREKIISLCWSFLCLADIIIEKTLIFCMQITKAQTSLRICSLISTFVVRPLESAIAKFATCKASYILASLWSWAGWTEPNHIASPKGRCSCVETYSKTCVKRPLKRSWWQMVAQWRLKVLQNAPLGAFCNTFDLH